MNKTTSTDIFIFLKKQQTDFGHFNASDSDARLLCVSVLSLLSPWETRKAQVQSSCDHRIRRPLLWSVNYLSNRWQTKEKRQAAKIDLSVTHYKGQEATIGRHLKHWRAIFCTSNRSISRCTSEWACSLCAYPTTCSSNHLNILGVHKLRPLTQSW